MSDSEEEWADALTYYSDDEFKDAEDDNLEYYSKRNPTIIKKSLFTIPEIHDDTSDSESETHSKPTLIVKRMKKACLIRIVQKLLIPIRSWRLQSPMTVAIKRSTYLLIENPQLI